jgi:hypothetical protein
VRTDSSLIEDSDRQDSAGSTILSFLALTITKRTTSERWGSAAGEGLGTAGELDRPCLDRMDNSEDRSTSNAPCPRVRHKGLSFSYCRSKYHSASTPREG